MALLTIDQEKCNRDGICVAECPARIIEMDSKDDYPTPAANFADSCIECGHCVAVCPKAALSLNWLRPEDCTAIQPELTVTPEQAEQFLTGRRSFRTFKEQAVPRNVLEKLIEVAEAAPSARNEQPWHWTVVQEPAEVRRLAGTVIDWMRTVIEAEPGSERAVGYSRGVAAWEQGSDRICRGAPHVIVAHGDKEWAFGAEDCALALSLLDLYATSIGLGVCWAGFVYSATNNYPPLFDLLGLPAGHRAFGAAMVGYPKFKYPRIPVRKEARVTWK
jgi:nitroreductase/NAD-dependent dihydropyrimidine dehydrogenase PreA subunit